MAAYISPTHNDVQYITQLLWWRILYYVASKKKKNHSKNRAKKYQFHVIFSFEYLMKTSVCKYMWVCACVCWVYSSYTQGRFLFINKNTQIVNALTFVILLYPNIKIATNCWQHQCIIVCHRPQISHCVSFVSDNEMAFQNAASLRASSSYRMHVKEQIRQDIRCEKKTDMQAKRKYVHVSILTKIL